ncbi:trypsin-like cysteine/serine peptidase domain-containing protein [Apodospora peruviana]|uniref:Trypsin-like cysteine/serine peptidase domain-containing protein n=1 Tax=Apodospora peruviana TaxID=516989 RepID=A0AAE0ITZ4_9PEZI|nr:trypsin-like cysteine/serine peptidase domain-containing protein [Apodospora peruviana]
MRFPTSLAFLFGVLASVAWTVPTNHPVNNFPLEGSVTTPSKAHNVPRAMANPKTFKFVTVEVGEGGVLSVPPSPPAIFNDKRDIIGSDDRVPWNLSTYPYSTMGIVSAPGFYCSGSLVGPRLVATARHCVPNDALVNDTYATGKNAVFQPNRHDYDDQNKTNTKHLLPSSMAILPIAWNLTASAEINGPCSQKHDWAILVLQDALGEELGYLGAKVIDCEKQKDKPVFVHMGYPGDKAHGKQLYHQVGVKVTECDECAAANGPGLMRTDDDAAHGQSGGPLFSFGKSNGLPYVYGVCSSGGPDNTAFAGGPEFVAAIAKARQEYD